MAALIVAALPASGNQSTNSNGGDIGCEILAENAMEGTSIIPVGKSNGANIGHGTLTPAANVAIGMDPATGTACTGTPLYFTGRYFLTGWGNDAVKIGQIMLTVIAPDGTKKVQTLDLSASKNSCADTSSYVWTTSLTLDTPGTYRVFAALTPDHGATWYQDINTYSTDGGTTWLQVNPTGGWTGNLLPLTSGRGNLTTFTVIARPNEHAVNPQALPMPGLDLWLWK